MAQNLVSNGPNGEVTVTLTAAYPRAIAAGDLCIFGSLIGISVRNSTGASGEKVTLITRGVASVTADAGATTANTAVGRVLYVEPPAGGNPARATHESSGGRQRLGVSVLGAAAGNQLEVLLGA